jgi:hypothetical protein
VRTVLHLVRPGATPRAVADRDWVVYLQPMELAPSAHPAPLPPGPLIHDQLVALSFAADLVVTW